MATKKVTLAKIERYEGQSIQLPAGNPPTPPMSYDTAIDILARQRDMEDQIVSYGDEITGVFPFDAALALQKAMKEIFGVAFAQPGFFGSPPMEIPVAVSATETIRVPWGQFSLPSIHASIYIGMNRSTKAIILSAELKRRDQPIVEKLFARVRELAKSESIYRGKLLSFRAGQPNPMFEKIALPEIGFINPILSPPIFSTWIEEAVEALILTPIRHSGPVSRSGIPLGRKAVLAGVPGTGKTLLSARIAREAVANGWTFIYVKEPSDTVAALQFSNLYQPAVVFVEDIDRVIGSERTDEVNTALNEIDGIDTKERRVILIMTTNHPDRINETMQRKGRIDLILSITAPDTQATARLIRFYGSASLAPGTDIGKAATALAGHMPATIRESVERAKLFALNRTNGDSARITGDDLFSSAEMVKAELSLFDKPKARFTQLEQVGRGIASVLTETVNTHSDTALRNSSHANRLRAIDNHETAIQESRK